MVNAKLQLERQDKRRLAQLREELGCFRSREKLEKQAREYQLSSGGGRKGRRRTEEEEEEEQGDALFLFLDGEECCIFVSFDCISLYICLYLLCAHAVSVW